MTQEERRIYLIRRLQEEMPRYGEIAIPADALAQRRLLRSLFNLRPPLPAAEEFLAVQDAYLREENREKGIVDGDSIPSAGGASGDPRLCLWKGDITRLAVGAIVNAANSALLGCFQPCHSCIDNVIHTYSGVQLRIACNEIMQKQGHEEPVGQAKITPAYNLPCSYVIHTVGPMIAETLREEDCQLLASCYRACLGVAVEKGLRSLAFCCISTGVFRFPQQEAARIAVDTVSRFLEEDRTLRQVIFNVFTDSDLQIYQKLLGAGRTCRSESIGGAHQTNQ